MSGSDVYLFCVGGSHVFWWTDNKEEASRLIGVFCSMLRVFTGFQVKPFISVQGCAVIYDFMIGRGTADEFDGAGERV